MIILIYTSYFAKLKKIPKEIIPISIARKAPNGFKGLEYKQLAPSYELLMHWKHNHDEEYYVKVFNQDVLEKLNSYGTISRLKQYANSDDIVLVCYEKSSDFCHRHLVATWLNTNGYEVKEWSEK